MINTAPATRFHPRVGAGFTVKLLVDGQAMVVPAEDVSMAGLKLVGDFTRSAPRVTVSLALPGDREICAQGTIRRRGKASAAVEFDALDWDDMIALARFVHPRL